MGYSPWGLKESDTTVTEHSHTSVIGLEWERVSCPSHSSTHLCLVGTAWAGDSFLSPPPQGERRVFYPFCDNSGSWTVSWGSEKVSYFSPKK